MPIFHAPPASRRTTPLPRVGTRATTVHERPSVRVPNHQERYRQCAHLSGLGRDKVVTPLSDSTTLDSMRMFPSETYACVPPSVSVRVIRALVHFLEQRGVPRATCLRSAQLNPERLASAEGRLTREEVYRLLEVALDLTGEPALGLYFGEKLESYNCSPISDLVSYAATLREGLDAMFRLHPLISDGARFELSEHAGKATLRRYLRDGASLRIERFVAEVSLVSLLQTLRVFFDLQARVSEACFEYAAPSYRAEYTRLFDGAESFDRPLTAIVFDRSLLDHPAPWKDEGVFEALRLVAERYLLDTERASFALRVRELLVRDRAVRLSDMGIVARALGLSVRSLRRRLAAEGVSYTSVANDACAHVAKQYLVNQRCSIQETAVEMGFSDPRAFHRAFRRWTGVTPDAFRKSRLGKTAGRPQLDPRTD